MGDMLFCAACKKNVPPSVTIDSQRGAIRVCPEHPDVQLEEPKASAAHPLVQRMANIPPVAVASIADLPKLVRERKKHLRTEIRRMQRELAQLDRLGTKRARKAAPVTALRRSVS